MRPITKLALLAGLILSAALLPHRTAANAVTLSSSICSTDPAVVISDPVDATQTQSSLVVVSGQATPGYDLTINNNSTAVAETIVGDDGTYSVSAPLTLGANTISAHIGLFGCTATVDSNTVNLIRLAPPAPPASPGQPPTTPTSPSGTPSQSTAPATSAAPPAATVPLSKQKLTATASGMRSGSSTVSSRVLIAGIAYPGARVDISLNGVSIGWVTADEVGHFLLSVPLKYGDNIISIIAPPLRAVLIRIHRSRDYTYVAWGAAAAGALTLSLFGAHVLIHHRRNPHHPAYTKIGWGPHNA